MGCPIRMVDLALWNRMVTHNGHTFTCPLAIITTTMAVTISMMIPLPSIMQTITGLR
ncbi:hypothetical protein NHH03_13525 [Stieleria sp. TO1_6]|uniref:hypothetical protein n=1 Tax=Stieleria tagensis TaxID=2956795 RepID=UPI00209BB90B|nr:hypothetical protein [Stieleria tagensis]MCO8122762.1 hypothetical protein [Stieleria tagensis]